eukprot:12433_1
MLLLLLLVAVTSKQYRQYDITDQSFDRFISRYGNNKLEYSSPIYPLLNVLHAIKNWSTVSDLNLPAPSEYPYFRWMPFWGNGSIPVNDTKKSNKVNFNPLNCFNDGSFYTQYNPNNSSEIIIHLELSNKSSTECRCALVFGTITRLTIAEFVDEGVHKIYFPLNYTNLSISDQFDLENKGIRLYTLLGDLEQTVADAIETADLFQCLATRTVTPDCAKKSVLFLKEYANITMEQRNTNYDVWDTINASLIHSGDFLGVIRLDGLDPMLGWAMGAHTGHTTIAIRDPEDNTLYIAESTNNSSYWPTNGIQRTEFHEWMTNAHLAGYQVVWEPLSDELRAKFNVTAALEFFKTVEGLNYGYQTMLLSWIDTEEDNYPCLPPDYKMCLTWKVLEVGLPLFERWISGFGELINPAFNKRLNVSNYSLSEIYYKAYLDGMESVQVTTIIEEDSWRYNMQRNDGSYVEGLSMVCCMFVCHMWKAGGLFDDLGPDNVNCNEFTNFDDYGLIFFNANFTNERPNICKEADPNNPLCQLMGEYSLILEKWNTITPHKHMAETCPSEAPDYNRPPDC